MLLLRKKLTEEADCGSVPVKSKLNLPSFLLIVQAIFQG